MGEPPLTVRRRNVLRTAAALSVAAVAGCTGALDDGELPPYGEDTPKGGPNDDGGVFFVHLDAAWLRTYDGGEELPYAGEFPDAVAVDFDSDTPPVEVDPLLAYPAAGLVVAALRLSFGLIPYGFGDELLSSLDAEIGFEDGGEEDEDDDAGGVRVDSILLVDGVAVFRGEFDARAIVAASEGFEPAAEHAGFDVYEGTGDGVFDTAGLGFAVRDDVLIAPVDEDADLDAVIDTTVGEVDRLVDEDDGDWLLRTGGNGHVTLGTWDAGPDEALDDGAYDGELVDASDALAGAVGVASSLTLAPEEGRASLAAVFPEGETPTRTAIENQVGTSTTSRDVSMDGNRISVFGAWRTAVEETTDG